MSLQAFREAEVTPSKPGSKAASCLCEMLAGVCSCSCVWLAARPAYTCENWLGVQSYHTGIYTNLYIYIYIYIPIYIYIYVDIYIYVFHISVHS